MRKLLVLLLILPSLAAAGEKRDAVSSAELQALDRAISREHNTNELGSQALGDLYRLRRRLESLQQQPTTTKSEREASLEPLSRDDSLQSLLNRLQDEAKTGDRAAFRSLALYYLFRNNPEQARVIWQRMGPASTSDLPYQLISAYLELALGEYNSARASLETAQRMIDSRTSLELSKPVFCENVAGYRLYVPRPPKEFLPGDETLIYVEVDGADFHPLPDGYSECRLMFGLKLMNDLGRTLWGEPNYGEYAPAFVGPIRDLHTVLSWRIPNDLEPGLYRLHVETMEQDSKRRGESVVEFNVARKSTNPETRVGSNLPPGYERTIRDAEKTFPGGPQSGILPGVDDTLKQNQNKYEILKQYENMNRGNR